MICGGRIRFFTTFEETFFFLDVERSKQIQLSPEAATLKLLLKEKVHQEHLLYFVWHLSFRWRDHKESIKGVFLQKKCRFVTSRGSWREAVTRFSLSCQFLSDVFWMDRSKNLHFKIMLIKPINLNFWIKTQNMSIKILSEWIKPRTWDGSWDVLIFMSRVQIVSSITDRFYQPAPPVTSQAYHMTRSQLSPAERRNVSDLKRIISRTIGT